MPNPSLVRRHKGLVRHTLHQLLHVDLVRFAVTRGTCGSDKFARGCGRSKADQVSPSTPCRTTLVGYAIWRSSGRCTSSDRSPCSRICLRQPTCSSSVPERKASSWRCSLTGSTGSTSRPSISSATRLGSTSATCTHCRTRTTRSMRCWRVGCWPTATTRSELRQRSFAWVVRGDHRDRGGVDLADR